MSKTAFLTGVSGQCGSHLTDLLLEKKYEVHGLIRRHSDYKLINIEHIKDKINLHWGDLENEHHICSIINEIKPDEIYNLAAQSDVAISFEIPEYTADVTGLGFLRLLEAVRKFSPDSKVYQASTSEMFGDAPPKQNENTPMIPNSPYAAAKLYAHNVARIYRKSYNMFISCGILFNNEGPRRGLNFVTRKITKAISNIVKGKQSKLYLGNLDAKRDWGYSKEYVEAMWLMLQQDKPDDFVIGTGEAHTIKEFVEEAFNYVNLEWKKYVEIDQKLYRPCEVNYLCADATKAKRILGWSPKVTFKELVRIMLEHDLEEK